MSDIFNVLFLLFVAFVNMLVEIQEMLEGRIQNVGNLFNVWRIVFYPSNSFSLVHPITAGRDSWCCPCVYEVVVYEHFIEMRGRRLL
jgi:hypothetical protein